MSLLYTKERDNTWLQLTVCPSLVKAKEDPSQTTCPFTPARARPEEACPFAHPPEELLETNPLSNGSIVSCHDYVFGMGHPTRRGCTRPNCRYFHPPDHLALAVKNNGKNNKRLRSQMLTSWQRINGFPAAAAAASPQAQVASLAAAAAAQQTAHNLYTMPLQQQQAGSLLPTPPYPPFMLPQQMQAAPQQQQQALPSHPVCNEEPDPPGTTLLARKRNTPREEAPPAAANKIMRREPEIDPQQMYQMYPTAASVMMPWVNPYFQQPSVQQQQQQQLALQLQQQELFQQLLLQQQVAASGQGAIKGLPVRY